MLLGCSIQPAQGQEASAQSMVEHVPERAWLEPYDPTLLTRRISTDFEYQQGKGDNAAAHWLLDGRWAWDLQKAKNACLIVRRFVLTFLFPKK
jgi:hypothetical protein